MTSDDLQDQISRLHAQNLNADIRALAQGMGEIKQSLAASDEWRKNVSERVVENNANLAKLTKDVAEIKDLASRYKGGLYAVMGLGAAITGVTLFWEKISKVFH